MLFKKRRVKKVKLAEVESWLKEVESDWASRVEHLQKILSSFNKTTDLGERYIALDEFEKGLPEAQKMLIDEKSQSMPLSFREAAEELFKISENSPLSTVLVLGHITFTGLSLLEPAIFLYNFLFSPMSYSWGGSILNSKRKDLLRAYIKNTEIQDRYEALHTNVKRYKQDLLRNHVLDFGHSSKFDVLYDKYPDVKKAFVQSTMQKNSANFPSQPKIKTKTVSAVRVIN